MDHSEMTKAAIGIAEAKKAEVDKIESLLNSYTLQVVLARGDDDSTAVAEARVALQDALDVSLRKAVKEGVVMDPLDALAADAGAAGHDACPMAEQMDVALLDPEEAAFIAEHGEGEDPASCDGPKSIAILHMLSPRQLLACRKRMYSFVDESRPNNSISANRGAINAQGRARGAVSRAMGQAILDQPCSSPAAFATSLVVQGDAAELSTLGPRVLKRFLTFER